MLNWQGLFGVEFDTARAPDAVPGIGLGTTCSTVTRIKWGRAPGPAPALDVAPVPRRFGGTTALKAPIPWVIAIDDRGGILTAEEETQCI